MAQQATTYRINRLAKDLNIKSKDILDLLTEAGLDGKTHMAILEPAEFNLFIDVMTKENQITNLDEYVKGEAVIPRKTPKKSAPKEENAEAGSKPQAESAGQQAQESKPEPKPETKPEPKRETKSEPKPEAKAEPQTPIRDQRPADRKPEAESARHARDPEPRHARSAE